ncbi:MAG: lactonase family protein [Aureibaculum sp.]
MRNAFITLLIILIGLISCKKDANNSEQIKDSHSFYLGTYTDGGSEGIYKYELHKDGELEKVGLAVITENPSFLTKSADGEFIIAVNEISNKDNVGMVSSFSIKGDSLVLIDQSSSGGAHPCFVTINPDSYILAANYTGGNVGLLKLEDNGELSNLLDNQQHVGSSITDRQQGPHAHSAWFTPDNNTVISVDLGTDALWFSTLDTLNHKLIPNEKRKLLMAPGAGPRHLVFHPSQEWIYVLNELDGTITLVVKNKDGIFEKKSSISSLPAGFKEPNTSADIHISLDGRFLYASNRGHNSIAIFEINENNGDLRLIDHESTHGDGPRNFALSPENNYLIVANQYSNNLVSFKRDKKTGLLTFVNAIGAPTPVCILF